MYYGLTGSNGEQYIDIFQLKNGNKFVKAGWLINYIISNIYNGSFHAVIYKPSAHGVKFMSFYHKYGGTEGKSTWVSYHMPSWTPSTPFPPNLHGVILLITANSS